MATVTIDSTEFTTYADVGEADAYAMGAIHATAWRTADDQTKAMALVTSTRILDRQNWVGEKTDPDQELAWPRKNTGVDGIEDDTIPQQVIDASIEIAIALVAGSSMQDDQSTAQTIQSLKAGSVAISYFRGAEGIPLRFPLVISELLRGLLKGGGLGGGIAVTGVATGTGGRSATDRKFGYNWPL